MPFNKRNPVRSISVSFSRPSLIQSLIILSLLVLTSLYSANLRAEIIDCGSTSCNNTTVTFTTEPGRLECPDEDSCEFTILDSSAVSTVDVNCEGGSGDACGNASFDASLNTSFDLFCDNNNCDFVTIVNGVSTLGNALTNTVDLRCDNNNACDGLVIQYPTEYNSNYSCSGPGCSNVTIADTDLDGDGTLDMNDPDDDNDGISDVDEIASGSDPLDANDIPISIELQKLLASDGAAFDRFGTSVSIDGDVALVGAYLDDDNGGDSGSAYVFSRDGSGNWTEQQKLTASDGAAFDQFGWSVAVDGDVALVGAYLDDDNGSASGSAYVFSRDGSGNWSEQAKLTASDGAASDYFGLSVAVDGDVALVGAYLDDDNGSSSGSAYVFNRDGSGNWTELQKLTASDGAASDQFGESVSIDGDVALVGAYRNDDNGSNSGSVYVFSRDGSGDWTEQQKLTASDGAASDQFGWSVAIDGDVALVGAYLDDDNFGDSGSAYVFSRDGSGNWTEQAKLTASDGATSDWFGWSVAIDGDVALVGAYEDDDNGSSSGSAYVFNRDGSGNWTELQKLTASDGAASDQFGFSVAVDGDVALVGAIGDDDNGSASGSAYIFSFTDADGDGLRSDTGADNCPAHNNPTQTDTDSDGEGDACDDDIDGDGTPNINDAFPLDPTESSDNDNDGIGDNADTDDDNDGMPDTYENANGLNSLVDDAASDLDGDGFSNFEEFTEGTDPNNVTSFPIVAAIEKLLAGDGEASDKFATSVVVDGDIALVGTPSGGGTIINSGSVYVYERNVSGDWIFSTEIAPTEGFNSYNFGASVELSGQHAFIGATGDFVNGTNSGSVHVYEKDASANWIFQTKLLASDGAAGDFFGNSLSISGDSLLVGAFFNDDNGADSGSAYIFSKDASGDWSQQAKLLPTDGAGSDNFGSSVSLSNDKAIIGAPFHGGASFLGGVYVFERDASGSWQQQTKLIPGDHVPGDFIGRGVGIDGDTAVISASGDDDNGNNSGSAYVFQFDGSGNWVEQDKLTASDGMAIDRFSESVSLSGDVIVIGARIGDGVVANTGSAYVFQHDGSGNWNEISILIAADGAADDNFGFSLALSGDVVLVGADLDDDNGSSSGSAYMHSLSDGDGDGLRGDNGADNCPAHANPTQTDTDGDGIGDACDPDDDNDGTPDYLDAFPLDNTEISDNDNDGIGDNADTDDDNDGMSDVYENANGLDSLDANGVNGANGDLDGDGFSNLEEALASSSANDSADFPFAILIDRELAGVAEAGLGANVAIDGDTAMVSAAQDTGNTILNGAVYVYENDGSGNWSQVQKFFPSDGTAFDRFGDSISLAGDIALIGAPGDDDTIAGSGSVYVFHRDASGDWSEQTKLVANDPGNNSAFGISVALSGSRAIIGTWLDDHSGFNQAGSAYVFTSDASGNWTQEQKLVSITPDDSDLFGQNVALLDDIALVGATGDDDIGTSSGAVYVFERNAMGNWVEQSKLTGLTASDQFGASISLSAADSSGNWQVSALIGAPFADGAVNGSGAAYLFTMDASNNWVQQDTLSPSSGTASDQFGSSVSMIGDVALISAHKDDQLDTDAGAAYLFQRNASGSWFQAEKIIDIADGTANDNFGAPLVTDGVTALFGVVRNDEGPTDNVGAAYFYTLSDADGDGLNILTGDNCPATINPTQLDFDLDGQGDKCDTDDDNDGTPDVSDAFPLNASEDTDTDGDGFGNNTDTDDDNDGMPDTYENANGLNTLVDDAASDLDGDGFTNLEEFTQGTDPNNVDDFPFIVGVQKVLSSDGLGQVDQFGYSVSVDGGIAAVGAWRDDSQAGAVYIFERDGSGNWSEQSKITASDRSGGDLFGVSVSLQDDKLIVGASSDSIVSGFQAGSAYVYSHDGSGNWNEDAKLIANDFAAFDNFGHRVDINYGRALVSTIRQNTNAGAVYIFTIDGSGNWGQQQKITASDAANSARFGDSVSLDGNTALIGSSYINAFRGQAYVFNEDGSGNWTEQEIFVASDNAAGEYFGISVSLDGGRALIGAYGNNGDGAAYIFERDSSGDWSETTKLTASDGASGDRFGDSVSLIGDVALVGAYRDESDQGASYLFARDGSGNWNEQEKLVAFDGVASDRFSQRFISIDETTALIGSNGDESGDGAAYFYILSDVDVDGIQTTNDNCRVTHNSDQADNDNDGLGDVCDADDDNDGTPDTDDAFPFDNTETADNDNDGIGNNADDDDDNDGLSDAYEIANGLDPFDATGVNGPNGDLDGDGVSNSDEQLAGTAANDVNDVPSLKPILNALPSDAVNGEQFDFGHSIAIEGDYAVVGAHRRVDNTDPCNILSGTAYVFKRDVSGNWAEHQVLKADDPDNLLSCPFADHFGYSVDMTLDTMAISAYGMGVNGFSSGGAVYVFELDGSGNWTQEHKLTVAEADQGYTFGWSVSIDGDSILVGTPFDDHQGTHTGVAYVFTRDGSGNWTRQARIEAIDAAAGDEFANSVAISGDRILIGAEEDDDNGTASGSAYIFVRDSSGDWSQQDKLLPGDGTAFGRFANAVALDGDTALVGNSGSSNPSGGTAYVFVDDGSGNWNQEDKFDGGGLAFENLGFSVALRGDVAFVGQKDLSGTRFGYAAVYLRDASDNWSEFERVIAADLNATVDERFGHSVAFSDDFTFMVGATDRFINSTPGTVYFFELDDQDFDNQIDAIDTDDDNDGMSDAYENANGLNSLVNDASGDLDGDGLTNLEEFNLGTAANDVDTDGDNIPDAYENNNGLNPLVDDAASDLDGDGFTNFEEFTAGTDPDDANDFPALAENDYNGDGNADMLIRNSSSGQWYLYQLDGTTILSQGGIGMTTNLAWQVVSTADFDDDGNEDVLLRNNATHQWYLYQLDGNTILGQGIVGMTTNSAWEVVSTDDFNNDGNADVLLRHNTTHQWYLYRLNGTTILNQGGVGMTTNSAWEVVSTDDFNNDGNADVLLRHNTTHQWYLYRLNGTTILNQGGVGMTTNSAWEVVSTDDFNNDGNADVLLRHNTTHQWYLYQLDGNTILGQGGVSMTTNSAWEVVSTDDHDGDGNADVLLRHNTTHQWYLYRLNGNTILGQGGVSMTTNSVWQVVSTDDHDGDGNADVLIRHSGTGQWYLYQLDGVTLLGQGGISMAPSLNWGRVE